jgi:hypothetical protein
MNPVSKPLPGWQKWLYLIIGIALIVGALYLGYRISRPLQIAISNYRGPKGHAYTQMQWMKLFGFYAGEYAGLLAGLVLGGWLIRRFSPQGGNQAESMAMVPTAPAQVEAPVTPVRLSGRVKRWNSCNILQIAPDAKRLWQFEAKGKNFVLGREQRVSHTDALPSNWVAKSWSTLWAPKLNIAWLPSEDVFLRAVELPAANAEETFSMVELQLEKLSPIPVTQVVWTMHPMGTHQGAVKADGTVEGLQTVIVVIASRGIVEEFLGRLERDGFLADRLEAPMLDQLEAVAPKADSVWVFPLTIGAQNAALVAWWFGGAWRNLSFVTLPPAGDRATELKSQLALLAMSGEVEGWLTAQPEWHLVADPVNATEWEQLLREGLQEPVRVSPPPPPTELAGRSALRAAASTAPVQLQPPEFAARYREQFTDRLWLHGLGIAGVLYAIGLVIYFCAVGWEGYQARGVEAQVAALGPSFTNSIELSAKLGVLQEREKLKFAALDCWQDVAEELPASVSLQRFGFANGERVTLSGTAPQDQVNTLLDFNEKLKKKKDANNQPVFDPNKGDYVNPKSIGNGMCSWSLSVELLNTETPPQ